MNRKDFSPPSSVHLGNPHVKKISFRKKNRAPPKHPLSHFSQTPHRRAGYKLQKIATDKLVVESLAETGGGALDNDAGTLEGGNLGVGAALAARDNGTGVTHAAAGRGGDAGDEGDDGLAAVDRVVLLEELGGVLLGGAANLANHDDAVRVLVLEEDVEAAGLRRLVDGLVSERAGARHDADAAALVDEAGHDANLALAGGDYAGAVGADETRLVLRL
ncbi:hypothetical protein LLEC1_05026 [Akanthomyces lecanii]|uniref:Uncharacterized protein n=1 Tax=Cordyceps confragosa TaxID=2714763 RepID=A0A179IB34_CORDF|nr:hypothetical protein LLEC1_05026 [Akanthomyces lecanii]